jgi:hypothetical protein
MLFQVAIGHHCDNHKRHKNARLGKLEFMTVNSKWYLQNTEAFWMFYNNSNFATEKHDLSNIYRTFERKSTEAQNSQFFAWLIPVPCKENEVKEIFQAFAKKWKPLHAA